MLIKVLDVAIVPLRNYLQYIYIYVDDIIHKCRHYDSWVQFYPEVKLSIIFYKKEIP